MVHIERALFVVGHPGAGKSTQLRSMFRDQRLGTKGKIPRGKGFTNYYALSNERRLYIRLTSPHEANESLKKFLDKCESKLRKKQQATRRCCFAGALQPNSAHKMPDAVTTIADFIARFESERVRVVFFHPDRKGDLFAHQELMNLLAGLQALPQTEIIMTDARRRTGNGLIYADFFDFT